MVITYKTLVGNKRDAVNVYVDDFFTGRIMREPNGAPLA